MLVSLLCYFIISRASPLGMHLEANPVFWLATQAGKVGLSCPFGIAHFDPAQEIKLLGAD